MFGWFEGTLKEDTYFECFPYFGTSESMSMDGSLRSLRGKLEGEQSGFEGTRRGAWRAALGTEIAVCSPQKHC